MKLLKTIIAATALSIACSASAATSEKEVRFVGETEFAGFCKAIINDDIKTFRSNISRNVGRIGDSQRHNWLMMLGSNPYPTRHSVTSVDKESLSVESQLEE